MLTDEAGNTASDPTCYSFTTPEIPDFFTQLFTTDNDLDNLSLFFNPNGSSDFYLGCAEAISALPTDPAGGTTLSLSDDSYAQVTLGGGATVSLYGTSYSSFYVGSNGYITFNSGDSTYTEALDAHFNQPRVSALFDDLNPAQGGTVSWKQLADRVAVTWLNVTEYSAGNQNTFQIELYFNGQIAISYLAIAATDGLAGLSRGLGLDPDFFMSDLSALGPCQAFPPTAHDSAANTNESTPVNITLLADGRRSAESARRADVHRHGAAGARQLGRSRGRRDHRACRTRWSGGGKIVVYTPATHYVGARQLPVQGQRWRDAAGRRRLEHRDGHGHGDRRAGGGVQLPAGQRIPAGATTGCVGVRSSDRRPAATSRTRATGTPARTSTGTT